MTQLSTRRLETLPVDECLGLLASRYVGRIAFIDGGAPQVLPVNYRLHEGEIVIRTDYGALLDAVHLSAVAFEVDAIEVDAIEVDAIDPDYHSGWSVVVHGKAEEVWRLEEIDTLRHLPPAAVGAGEPGALHPRHALPDHRPSHPVRTTGGSCWFA